MNEAFVYCWTDWAKDKLYIGVHIGSPDDGYVCSSIPMKEERFTRPGDFTRTIVASGSKENMYSFERTLLKVVDAKNDPHYYNKSNGGGAGVAGEKHWAYGLTGDKNPNYKNRGEKSPLFGKKNPAASKVNKGRKRPDHSKKMSGESNPMFGKKRTEEELKGLKAYANTKLYCIHCGRGMNKGALANHQPKCKERKQK
jgi:hypothetical protein